MNYNPLHEKRRRIFEQFLFNKRLSFSELEKATRLRSNYLAYFLDKLEKEKIIEKNNSTYRLSKEAEYYIPFFVDNKDKLSPLPVVLVHCIGSDKNDNKVLLVKREKRPFKDMWSMPGGRIKLNERISRAAERVLKEKTFIDAKYAKVNSIMHEKVKQDANRIHSYILFFVTAKAISEINDKERVRWFSIDNLPENMIPSDKHLILNDRDKKYDLKEEEMESLGNPSGDGDKEEYKIRFLE